LTETIHSQISLKNQALCQDEYGIKQPLCEKAEKLNCQRVLAEALRKALFSQAIFSDGTDNTFAYYVETEGSKAG
jgi:regulatory protein YycH of two-component signal transduction system YycFG